MANTQVPLNQPPFAPQLYNPTAAPMGAEPHLQHGYMIWDVSGGNGLGYTGGPYNGRALFKFLFNPQNIYASFATEVTTAQASLLYNMPGASSTIAIPLSQSVQWTLYFDRTFEVNYNKPSGQVNDPAIIGVQADVLQMMQFTGMLSNLAAGSAYMNTNSTKTAPKVTNKGGIMTNILSWVYFGQPVPHSAKSKVKVPALQNQLAYYGFVSGWDVNYTAFTQEMVPYRATMDITFQLMPSTSASQNKTGALAQGILDPYGNLANYVAPKKAGQPKIGPIKQLQTQE